MKATSQSKCSRRLLNRSVPITAITVLRLRFSCSDDQSCLFPQPERERFFTDDVSVDIVVDVVVDFGRLTPTTAEC